MIFLCFNPKTDFVHLLRTREFQSNYVKNRTRFNNMDDAATFGNIANMNWLFSHGIKGTNNIFYGVCVNSNIVVMEWLLAHGNIIPSHVLNTAAKFGNLDNMQWLFKNGFHLDSWTFNCSAVHGDLKNMKWLIKNGCAVSSRVLNSIKWFFLNGYSMDWSMAQYPLKCYKGDILKWMIKNGCPWDKNSHRRSDILLLIHHNKMISPFRAFRKLIWYCSRIYALFRKNLL